MVIMPWSSRKEFFKQRSKVFVDVSETSGDITSPLKSFLKDD
jgi:hypothetical protein